MFDDEDSRIVWMSGYFSVFQTLKCRSKCEKFTTRLKIPPPPNPIASVINLKLKINK